MLHLPILGLLLAFYHHCLLVRVKSPISLKSHSFLAAKEGSGFLSADFGLDTRHILWELELDHQETGGLELDTVYMLALDIIFNEKPTPIRKSQYHAL